MKMNCALMRIKSYWMSGFIFLYDSIDLLWKTIFISAIDDMQNEAVEKKYISIKRKWIWYTPNAIIFKNPKHHGNEMQ